MLQRTDQIDPPLPADLELRRARERLATEVETRLDERRGQHAGGVVHRLERLPRLEGLQRRRGIDRGDLGDRRVLRDVHPFFAAKLLGVQETRASRSRGRTSPEPRRWWDYRSCPDHAGRPWASSPSRPRSRTRPRRRRARRRPASRSSPASGRRRPGTRSSSPRISGRGSSRGRAGPGRSATGSPCRPWAIFTSTSTSTSNSEPPKPALARPIRRARSSRLADLADRVEIRLEAARRPSRSPTPRP